MIVALAAIGLGSYLIGSIPTGYLLGRLARVDVREHGSGNVGATNVARTAGRTLGLLTLLIDVAKGAVPVLLATSLELLPRADPAFDQKARIVAALGAFSGHVFSIALGFRGGKGVATALGAILALSPVAVVLPLLAFAGVFALSRVVSLASIVAAVSAPIGSGVAGEPLPVTLAIAAMAIVIVARHRANISRLLSGTESRFGRPT